MRKFLSLAFVVATLGGLSVGAHAESIGPGSPAPALDVKEWFKGTPVKTLEAGRVYVVEFWATWCGPCKQSIPHVTELAKKNADVTFIGVSIWEENKGDNIKNFVAEMGEKMNYTIGWSGNQEGMSQSWMRAASQNGIPAAFIVKDGTIQWVGHPMEMDGPLSEIKSGKFDLAKFKLGFDKEAAENQKRMAVGAELNKVNATYDAGKPADAKKLLAEFSQKYPDQKSSVRATEFGWLAKEDAKAWKAQCKQCAESNKADDMQMVLSFALRQATPKGNQELGKFAIEAALKATKMKEVMPLNYASAFFERTNDYKRALEMQDKLEALIPTMPKEEQSDWTESIAKKKAALKAKLKSA